MLELLSSWGHEKLIGLTEVIMLDEVNNRIDVNTAFLRLDGATNVRGHESNIFNNKFRVSCRHRVILIT